MIKKILLLIITISVFSLGNNTLLAYNKIPNNTEKIISDTFYYNQGYIKDKSLILNTLSQDIKKGVKLCFDKGEIYFLDKKNVRKYCVYQIKHFLKNIEHPLTKIYPYNIDGENNFFFKEGINIIDNPLLKEININKTDGNVNIDYTKNVINYKNSGIYLQPFIIKDFEDLNEAYKDEYKDNIILNSGFRNIQDQKNIYDKYIKIYGKEQKLATKPGFSEHHLGTAIDIKKVIINETNKNYDWLYKNSWKYGFIKTYDYNCMALNIINEDWHYRWLGKKIATEWKQWKYNNPNKCNVIFLDELNNK